MLPIQMDALPWSLTVASVEVFRAAARRLRRCRCSRPGVPVVFAARAVFLLLVSVVLLACTEGRSANSRKAGPVTRDEVPVTVAVAVEKSMPVQLRAIGRVQAYSTVTVKAQVAGEVQAVHFREGQEVKKGDMLFTIDPRPYEAQLKQAEANLAKDRAQLGNAKKQAGRYASVVQKGYVSEEQFDLISANAAALEASANANEAAVETARLSLKYCYIRSPIDGCAGELKVDIGNVIKANDSDQLLVTIRQTSPVNVSFSVPEQYLPDIRKYMEQGRLTVLASTPGKENVQVQGILTFVDNAVDFATGTILLKAEFENRDKALWPGQFANVVLALTEQPGVVVVPLEAVQTGQSGQYAYVVSQDLAAEYRAVVAGRSLGNEIVVEKGIVAGERVVTDGQMKLTNGSKVKVVNR
jgi:membrane fusion protein, multidrug efflux system